MRIKGVISVEVDFDQQLASVRYDKRRTGLEDMIDVLGQLGHPAWSTATERRMKAVDRKKDS